MDNLKIGARQLHEEEINLILPTYNQILNQIGDMRASLSVESDESKNNNNKTSDKRELHNVIQKTNNIGILGCRGAGKTSVLKTIMNNLKYPEESERLTKSIGIGKNIVLPIIIPENMSNASTLMATILGLFKNEVEKITDKENKNVKCIQQENISLKNKYTEVIKQYTFIQKEYRDLLISEFTTETEYVKKSNEIFNSDIEFITKFNEFIDELVKTYGEETLIFFFIDDIDLSASRCTDVIKTLLSYISHRNIVTFISGDLDTFEEALSIDFLRQENALTNLVWDGEFLNGGERLIERKKLLAYEYLKKVIPPVLRHNIKHWSLESRGDYVIKSNHENSSKKLSDLLIYKLNGYIVPSFFKIINYNHSQEEQILEDTLPYIYHIFDDTSRGLNNVYSVLLSIKRDEEDDEKLKFEDRKILIETIAASKSVFNKFRNKLFSDVINFGIDEKSTIIRFDNLKYMLDIDLEREKSEESQSEKITDVEKFQLFIFVDFASRLINYKERSLEKNNDYYDDLKMAIINILIKNPRISGSSFRLKESNELKVGTLSKDTGNAKELVSSAKELVSNFLLKSELDLALTLYRNLSKDTYEIILNANNNKSAKELQGYIWKVYTSIKSVAQIQRIDIKDYITGMYNEFSEEFAYIQDSLSPLQVRNTVELLCADTVEASKIHVHSDLEKDSLYTLIYNFIYSVTKDSIFGDDYRIKSLDYEQYKKSLDKQELLRLKFIYNIYANKLWDHPMVNSVKAYIEDRLIRTLTDLFKSNNKSINIANFKGNSFMQFKNIYKGATSTRAKELEASLTELMEHCEHNESISFEEWEELKTKVSKLAYNNRVLYGQYEAQKMLNEINQLYPTFINSEDTFMDHTDLIRVLHYFANYTIIEKDIESIYLQSEQLSEFINDISCSLGKVNDKMISGFIESINKDLEEKVNLEQFEKLFKQEKQRC